jgi:hypothetical protein
MLLHVHRYLEAVPGVEVLVLHGAARLGKRTTLSRAIAEALRMADVPLKPKHGGRVQPSPKRCAASRRSPTAPSC